MFSHNACVFLINSRFLFISFFQTNIWLYEFLFYLEDLQFNYISWQKCDIFSTIGQKFIKIPDRDVLYIVTDELRKPRKAEVEHQTITTT